MIKAPRIGRVGRAVWAACLLALGGVTAAQAQRTTSSIRGKVTDQAGAAVAGATVAARNTATGFHQQASTRPDGGYVLPALPPGTYDLSVSAMGQAAQTRRLEVLVAQDVTLNVQLTSQAVQIQGLTATATRAPEVRTSEVATNVTRQDIQNLPVRDRNFLSLAAMAPGFTNNPPGNDAIEPAAGALPSQNINVFVDGASLKSDVLPGGVAGQDASQGNPFPQNAVQEFRVITQNFKAEYQKASSAIITAVTRSGGNRWEGNAFAYAQPHSFVSATPFQDTACINQRKAGISGCDPTANYQRWQAGASVGGPIIADRLHLFASWEGNYQDRTAIVVPGQLPAGAVGLTQAQINAVAGPHVSPFRENLFFGKLTYQVSDDQFLELSGNLRREHEDRGFGNVFGTNDASFQRAEHFVDNTDMLLLRHQVTHGDWLNQAQLNFQRFNWNPNPLNPDLPGLIYNGVVELGGSSTYQNFTQRRIELRNDLTYSGFKWAGDHVVKGGAYVGFLNYHVVKQLNGNPTFWFGYNPSAGQNFDAPYQAQIGFGNPDLSTNNTQVGVYLQDDWSPSQRLQLNLGVRWDFETDMRNNDFVTPDSLRAKFSAILPPEYFSNGRSSRPPFYGAFQPRVGLSYDLSGDGGTVLFAGAGLYYDRDVYNDFLDEKFRRQWSTYTFHFNSTGPTASCGDCIKWDPSYMSRQGLINLVASGSAPAPDQYFLSNDVKPPYSWQWSGGIRHAFGDVVASATYTGNRGYNGVSYIWGHRNVNPNDPNALPPTGDCCQWGTYGATVVSDAHVRTWYDALQLQVQRPLTQQARWGGSASFVLGRARKTGGDLFSFDFPRVSDYPVHPTDRDQRYGLNLFGTVRLPAKFLASTVWELGSGYPTMITDCTAGYGPGQCKLFSEYFRPEKKSFIIPNAFAYRRVDLRLQKDLVVGPNRLSIQGEAFNAFNFDNYGCFDTWEPATPDVNTHFGAPTCTDPARRFQVGVTYSFR